MSGGGDACRETVTSDEGDVIPSRHMRGRGWQLTAERPVGQWKREDPTFAIWGVHVEAPAVPRFAALTADN